MRSVNIHEAKTHLSRLVEQAAAGEPFIIAKSGKPIVKVTAIDTPCAPSGAALDFYKAKSMCPTISTKWGARKLNRCFPAAHETAA